MPAHGSSLSPDEQQLMSIHILLQNSLQQVRSLPLDTSTEAQLSLIQSQLQDKMQMIRTMHPHITPVSYTHLTLPTILRV